MPSQRRPTGAFEVERTTGTHEVLDRLFVYSTLRQGQTARSVIANEITRCVKASAKGAIYAFPMGFAGYTEGDGRVTGEVVWLKDLAATFALLDAYEGTDFVRIIRQVTLETGEVLWAWVYSLVDPTATGLGTRIEDGDWVRYWTEQA